MLSLWGMPPETSKFQRKSRLSKKKDIENLFSSGKSFSLPPIRIIYSLAQGSNEHRLLFSVPSKIYKRATDRNLLKRRMREAYRINQSKFEVPVKLNVAYIYIAKKLQPFSEIEKKVVESFKRLSYEFKE